MDDLLGRPCRVLPSNRFKRLLVRSGSCDHGPVVVRLFNAAGWNHAFAAWENVNLAGCRLNMTCMLAAGVMPGMS
ncbi:hypothetical protein ACGFNP_55605 [Nonomuraea sp. NPDC049269]|uniref:hypothetical protein n=1 Tax=Nonomuraea sp. NPDC049269 TaxID=3364349 RepID=UPI00371F5661